MTTQLTLVDLPRRPRQVAATPATSAGVEGGRTPSGDAAAPRRDGRPGAGGRVSWRIDERTRRLGLAGVAQARAVLASSRAAVVPAADDGRGQASTDDGAGPCTGAAPAAA